jgi:hypothetical protein
MLDVMSQSPTLHSLLKSWLVALPDTEIQFRIARFIRIDHQPERALQ